ncbi:3-methyladenine DNA glycosylase [Mycobacterium sp. CBMA271]|uniref:DNA-3-methyladenine glycosylase family protein n=1 Tax=unclassified Mycobacteroides TaxID=2618759 RepID=UPI0012DD20C1|nr:MULTISPECIES: 3-methyladenine DNA glycosylase [unclassified Mycobacteroides]MUM19660.1 3-methyladenine DNA glycosylase [Mycobacteroides sp. CBMA 326]MUM24262.1 3-methyladenine DNA glycosylase [Mycobacteroides sp. CBMA 271]
MDIRRTLGIHRRGSGDPTYRISPGGSITRASHTPDGPGVLTISREDKTVVGRAYGDGAEWLLDRLPRLLGADDEPEALIPKHDAVTALIRGATGVRLGATDRVWESLVPAVLEQKVPGAEAWRAWRYLIDRFGVDLNDAKAPPPQREWLDIPSWEWHKSGIEPVRMHTLRAAAHADVETKPQHLQAIRGIGPWTEAEVRARALGDPDAVPVGDYHIAGQVGLALAGRKTNDAEMLELLEPYAGQRYRVIRLIELVAPKPTRRGSRMPVRDYRSF